jgi:hypothetical protein
VGVFSKKDAAPPVRNDKVRELLKLGMKETDAADRSVRSADFRRAKDALDQASQSASKAELQAAHDALRRHGY